MQTTIPPAAANVPTPDRPNTRPLEWSPSTVGSFSGIDYRQNGAADSLDPYFVWADVSGFAHLRKPGQRRGDMGHVPTRLPVLVALQDGITPQRLLQAMAQLRLQNSAAASTDGPELSVHSAYQLEQNQVPGGVLPAVVNRAFFSQGIYRNQALAHLVRRIEIDLPQEAQLALKPLHNDHKPVKRKPLQGKVMALIDDGCAFAHPHFATRVKRLWDMNVRGPLSSVGPPDLFPASTETYPGEFGRDFTDGQLNPMVQARTYSGRVDEEAVYADFAKGTLDNVNRLQGRAAHGTHVMDMACGPYFVQDTMCTRTATEPANPMWDLATSFPTTGGGQDASDAQIIFVQLPMRTVQDTSGRNTMTKDVINALTYIVSQCDDNAQLVVNLSWGALAGPHDGSHALEQHMDALIASQRMLHPMAAPGNRLQITMPAGNGYQSRTHANFVLAPLQSQLMRWRTEPDDATESYVEIWLPQGMQVELRVADPSGNTFPVVVQGDVRNFASYFDPQIQNGATLGVCYNDALLQPGQNGHCVLLALAPTVSLDMSRVTAPHGVWTVQVKNVSAIAGVVDAYIERDDVALGTRRGARQSHFEDPHYDRQAVDDNVQVDPECPTPEDAYVRREGVFNNISTGQYTEKVGGVRETDLEIAEYSPHGFYSARPKRPSAATPVTYYATSEESRTLRGVRAAGTRSGGTVRLSGTSTAAPQIARDLFNEL
jgi:hypothetical protein